MRTRALIVLGLAASVSLTACAGSSGSGSNAGGGTTTENGFKFKGTVLQPLPDGFPKQPITLLGMDVPSSDDGIYARTMQEALSKISPVTIKVQDRVNPTFGSWTGMQYMQSSKEGKEGYIDMVASFTGAAPDLVQSPITKNLGYTLKDANPVSATESVPFTFVVRGDGPWKTYQDFVADAKAHPGQLKYAANPGSQTDLAMARLMQHDGWTAKKLAVGSSTKVDTTLGAGAADFGMSLPGAALPHTQAGKIRVLLVIGDTAPAPWQDATTTKAIGMPDEPWGSLRGFWVPPEVPAAHREWLAELFRKAAQTPEYKKRETTLPGLVFVDENHDKVVQVMQQTLTYAEPLLRQLHLAWDQQ
jgi:tripartite-type tricarboxylate transporter receptor subunit TctC